MATLNLSILSKTLTHKPINQPTSLITSHLSFTNPQPFKPILTRPISNPTHKTKAAVDGDYSSRRSSSSEPRETIMLPGCDYNHWLIVMEFPKDPAPTREQMIDTYLETLATVLGRMFYGLVNGYGSVWIND
ncbi:hypothetical protein M8C21_004487 [Ambrosia artemisiifolia]|uniref:MORF/ORRM1/DAG-like MORF domain-containing protein n=1 Tax=Ambrosia artemisiifolia TaxID=4212 RepID=A0AAD5DBA7_AMBAR|nr:hypothetical protein M8C21_004487 [Ambrosia artemisiifolia]